MNLTQLERERYKKQLQLDEIGPEGQLKLKQASVLVIGAGGLGSPLLMYLTAAGIGNITIVDGDRIALANMQRQVIHETPAIGEWKVNSARDHMLRMNPEIRVNVVPAMLEVSNAAGLFTGQHVVVDCTDNLETRLLINETCARLSIPFVFGAVYEYEGQVSVFDASRGPCLRCMLPEHLSPDAIPDPEAHGLLGTVPGIIGLLQANEVLKLVLGLGTPLIGELVLFNALTTSLTHIHLRKRIDCPVCGNS